MVLFLIDLLHRDQPVTESDSLRLDLTYLTPLWKLYEKLGDDHGPEKTKPVLRALTELFLVAEKIAMVGEVQPNMAMVGEVSPNIAMAGEVSPNIGKVDKV